MDWCDIDALYTGSDIFQSTFFLNLISYHVLANNINNGLTTIGVVLAQLKHQTADHKKERKLEKVDFYSTNMSFFTS